MDRPTNQPFTELGPQEFVRGEFNISTDRAKIDLNVVHGYLTRSYWANGISRTTVERSLLNSLCFGLYHHDDQIGFARVITDYCTIAYLADVFVLDAYQSQGLGKWLVQTIVEHALFQDLRKWVLMTDDAQGLYLRFGFQELSENRTCMERRAPDQP